MSEEHKTPEVIYLIEDEEDTFLWCEAPAPGVNHNEEDAVKYIRADTRAEGWVSVSEKLPRAGLEVLVFGEVIGIRKLYRGEVNTVGNGLPVGVTHWCELPTPPTE